MEGSRSNVFFAQRGCLYTPSLRSGCLSGITREYVIRYAKEQQIPVKKTQAKIQQLLSADEAFLTGSTLEIMPIRMINKVLIGKGKRGPLTALLSKTYRQRVQEMLKGKNNS